MIICVSYLFCFCCYERNFRCNRRIFPNDFSLYANRDVTNFRNYGNSNNTYNLNYLELENKSYLFGTEILSSFQ